MSLFSVSINVLITCGETNGRLTWCFVCSRLLQSLLLLRLCLNAHSRGATDDVTAIASPGPGNTVPADHGAHSSTNKTHFYSFEFIIITVDGDSSVAEVSWEASSGVSVKCLPCCVELFPVPDPVVAVSFCRNCLPGIHSFCGSLTSPYQAPEDADAGLVHVRLPLPLRQQHIRFSRDPAGMASTGVLSPASQAPLTAVSQPNADACH